MTSSAKVYAYVIAGGGSAACDAAMRLVRDHRARVLILERGKPPYPLADADAGGLKFFARENFLEMHRTEPQARLGGRAPIVPRARVLGGGSSVNAMAQAPAGPMPRFCGTSAASSAIPGSPGGVRDPRRSNLRGRTA